MTQQNAAFKTAPPPAPSIARRTPFGYRIRAWGELTGQSKATIYRQIAAGKLHVIRPNGIPTVPHSEAIRLGYVSD